MLIDIDSRRRQIAGPRQAPVSDRLTPNRFGVAHRLCVVAGLIHIQTTGISANVPGRNETDILLMLEQTGRRIDAVVGLHRSLAASPNRSVQLGKYLRDICAAALACSARPDATRLHFAAEPDCRIRPDRALSMGLILGELATNAIRFSHPTGVLGMLEVSCVRDIAAGGIALSVADDGIGLPEHFDPRQSPHLGLRIVCALADQLGAVLHFDNEELGLSVRLQVPLESANTEAS